VITGQRVRSPFAHEVDQCILLPRTDPEPERHAGLTYFVLLMHAPGVEVCPLRQITGEAEFNERANLAVMLTVRLEHALNRLTGLARVTRRGAPLTTR
jgi:alkylation response protein AidB-like acyl-CoA dehydrogenase